MDACAYVGNKISQAISSKRLNKKDEELDSEPHADGRPSTCMLKGKKPTQNGAVHRETRHGEQSQDSSDEASLSPPLYL